MLIPFASSCRQELLRMLIGCALEMVIHHNRLQHLSFIKIQFENFCRKALDLRCVDA
jgi:hypothetical protein